MKPSVCAIIPARGGSKGLPGKNIKPLAGKPLIHWSIEAALNANCIERVLVSTDCPSIAESAEQAGASVPFLRPNDLATDRSVVMDAVEHLLLSLKETENYACDYVALLQPTSPLRTANDIDYAFARLREMQATAVVSVCEAQDHPYLCRTLDEKGELSPFIAHRLNNARRQDLPKAYVLNGALYLQETTALLAHRCWAPKHCFAYSMPRERSIDIDTLSDFELAERYLSNPPMGMK